MSLGRLVAINYIGNDEKKCLDINFAKYLSEFMKVHYFNDISGNTGQP